MQVDLGKLAKWQDKLARKICLKRAFQQVELVAGADFGYGREEADVCAGIVVMKFPELEIVEISQVMQKVKFPYIPAFLAFREGPVFVEAFRRLKTKPDVTIIDGNGIAHPRKMGLATYAGIVLDIATIGCAKNPFYPFQPPSETRGAYTFYMDDKKKKVGVCLRTRRKVKPVFVSPGHRIDIKKSMEIVLQCSLFRIPEPLRAAHRASRQMF